MDTIFALATAQGKAGVAVVRISGPKAWEVGRQLCGALPDVRKAAVRVVRASDGSVLDEALVLTFAEKHSFTGEQTVELHLHGSIAGVRAVLAAISDTGHARIAEPGEFTRRALMNERMDLTQVEGLADLIDAETEVQRREAMRTYSGELRLLVDMLRSDLVRSAALLEATIDFADEEVPEDVYPEVTDLLAGSVERISRELDGVRSAQAVRNGFEVAIVGPPNVGKSTLLNALAGREAAITSEIAGTTRDVVEVRMDVQGMLVTFLDTAGVRETDDPVEKIGVRRALERAEAADLRLLLVDNAKAEPTLAPRGDDLVVRTKGDLHGDGISALRGIGVNDLLSDVARRLQQRTADVGLVSRERDRVALETAHNKLVSVVNEILDVPVELSVAEIYSAVRSLDSVIGRVGVEDVLDEIFSSFCLGK